MLDCQNGLEFLMLLILIVEKHTVFTMIIEGTTGIKVLTTVSTGEGFGICMDFHHFFDFLSKMDPQAMNHTVSLGEGLKHTTINRATELLLLFLDFRMLGAHVKIQSLLLQETLMAHIANMIQFFQMLLHMIMHGILVLLGYTTIRTYIVSVCVLGVLNRHVLFHALCSALHGPFNFYSDPYSNHAGPV